MSSTQRNTNRQYSGTVRLASLDVLANVPVGDAYWQITLAAASEHTAATPGQFFHLACPPSSLGEPFLRRPMSIYCADPARAQIEFLYKVTGAGTCGLSTLVPGKSLSVLGPLGVGFRIDDHLRHALIVARGVGIATMAPLAQKLAKANVALTTIWSGRSPESAIGQDRFEPYGDFYSVFDSDQTSSLRSVELLIESIDQEHEIDAIYACGSQRLARLLRPFADRHNLLAQVALEQQMACGLGMCHACVIDRTVNGQVESARVCTVGPVFDLSETT
ncbi:MAG: dihydroorotate dehydrogenase electron transfer subunit [Acidimicrobiales bacterium]